MYAIRSYYDHGRQILDLVLNAGPVVKLVLLLLVYFSVVSWAIIFYKFMVIHRAIRDSHQFLDFFWAKKRFDVIGQGLRNFSNSPLTVLFREGYQELIKVQSKGSGDDGGQLSTDLGGAGNVARALRRATTQETHRLEKFITTLATTSYNFV